MKFLHIADLHLGKSVAGVSMLENGDQRDWIDKFLALCDAEQPDAVLVAGDVYDRSAPSGNAVDLLDYFLTSLAGRGIPVCLIAGNHDSGQRLSFANKLLTKAEVHIAGVPAKEMKYVTFHDALGPVHVWMMPYLFPELISELLDDDSIRSYDAAVRKLLAAQPIDFSERNVLIAHQNVTAGGVEVPRGGSESMVGGVGAVDFTAFDGFEYVALGHIHSGYPVGRPGVRYAGTPLCYHFSETRQKEKGVVVVELGPKAADSKGTLDPEASVKIRTVAIEPLHRMRSLRGTKAEIYDLVAKDPGREEYVGIHITDERIAPETSVHLRSVLESRGTVLMELLSDYQEYAGVSEGISQKSAEEKPLEELFSEFYEKKSGGVPPDDAEYAVLHLVGEAVRNSDCHLPLEERTVERVLDKVKKIGGGV